MLRIFSIVLLVLILNACATPTPYQVGGEDKLGYRDLKLQENRYRIAFHGNSLTSRETVETYLLYRAAELTLANGMDYFLIQDQDTDIQKTYLSTPPRFSAVYGFGPRRRGYPYYAFGYNWAQPSVSESTRYAAIAYVYMKKGKAPEEDLNAFDAREVIKNLESKIKRPKEK